MPIAYDQDDLHSLALVAWKEARGEAKACIAQGLDPNCGMRAVMHVCVNRAFSPGFAKNLHDVIYAKNQFTSMSVPSDPEFDLQPAGDDQQFVYCVGIAEEVCTDADEDPTLGACYYANLHNVTSGWFVNHISGPDGQGVPPHVFLTKIGHQSFYR